ncbi:MAG TPA: Calx-beta domain-containing protein, partial [Humisphaera sp.]
MRQQQSKKADRKSERRDPAADHPTTPHYVERLEPRWLLAAAATAAVKSFSLIDADRDVPVAGYESIRGDVRVSLASLPTRNITFRANLQAGTVGSVAFAWGGSALTDNSAPFAAFGGTGRNYSGQTPAAGTYHLSATPYTKKDGGGKAGKRFGINVTIIDGTPPPLPAVQALSLIDARTGTPVPGYEALTDLTTINLATLPTRKVNIRAVADPASPTNSVWFGIDGRANRRLDGVEPFSVGGDLGGAYLTYAPKVGFHSVTATPYDRLDGKGTAGPTRSVRFNVIDVPQLVPPVVAVHQVQTVAAEGSGRAVEFLVTRSGQSGQPLQVPLVFGGDATAGTDYDVPPATLTFAPGQLSASVRVSPKADGVDEGAEVVSLAVPAGAGYSVDPRRGSATGRLVDSAGQVTVLDFDADPAGNPLAAGTVVTDQFAAVGVTVEGHGRRNPAMIYDSGAGGRTDPDLGTPTRAFGGPGPAVDEKAGP